MVTEGDIVGTGGALQGGLGFSVSIADAWHPAKLGGYEVEVPYQAARGQLCLVSVGTEIRLGLGLLPA